MRRQKVAFVLCAFLLLAPPAFASIVYDFDFYNMTALSNAKVDDFSITLTYSDYVQATGMSSIAGPLTPLGYSVLYAGTNTKGWWGFSDALVSNMLTNVSFTYTPNSILFFLEPNRTSYYDTPGTYGGGYVQLSGLNDFFYGRGTLTITDTNAVPIPGAVWLLGSGLIGLLSLRKKLQR